MLTLVLLVIFTALVFEFINGFHDTANSIATVVATKVLSPGQAVMLAAGMNLIGAFAGTAVAKTIASGLVDMEVVNVTSQVILCATGAEALYADMGHLGRKPIVRAWRFVFAALVLCYLGQGALLLRNPAAKREAWADLLSLQARLR